jgi:hypothetical protein
LRIFLGPVVRLQVQQSGLKLGDGPLKTYNPSPLREVPSLELSEDGAIGCGPGDELIVDVHNRRHPASKNAGVNAVSLGFTSHYATMRTQFGPHLADGLAGENILVEIDRTVSEEELAGGILIETPDGQSIRLERILVAEPCVPFTRYALQFQPEAPSDPTVTHALQELRHGRRGFYASYLGPSARVRPGDQVFALPLR